MNQDGDGSALFTAASEALTVTIRLVILDDHAVHRDDITWTC